MISQLISSFNAGELSPYLESRTSLDKYRSGCKILENFIITPYGPANRRPGSEYLGSAKTNATRSRLIGLNISDSNRYVMELGVGYVRFWKNGQFLPTEAVQVDYTGATTGITPVHPYQEADLRGVQVCQINNVVYLAHPSYPPQRLSHYSDSDWRIGEVTFGDASIKNNWAPMLDQNVTATTITPSATTGSIILTASTDLFKAGHVGSYWEIAHPNPTTYISQNIDSSNATSPAILILGKWDLTTFGTWNAQVDLQASTDNGATWVTRRTYKSAGDYNAVSNGEEVINTLFRIKVSGFSSTASSTAPRVMLSPLDPTLKGIVRITGITDARTATAVVLRDLGGTAATSQWREGAFSAVQGYPATVALHESRVIFAGTPSLPSTLWGSATNDFQNFKQGAYDADSWMFTLASQTGGQIQWLVSKTALLIGSALDEWSMSASDQTRPITPTNVNVRQQSHYGSSPLGAQIINDTILYIQRMNRKIRELVYTWASESWVSNDITALAEHTTRTGIVETAYQRVPDAILWFVRGDGQLVSMTYEREQQVVGFARHLTDGIVESVATINGQNGEDEVYILVNRTINGATARYIERLKTGMRAALDTADKANWFYVDAGVKKAFSNPQATISGLDHLEGKSVAVWAGSPYTDKNGNTLTGYAVSTPVVDPATNAPSVVKNGSITLQEAVTSATIGIPFTSTMVPQRVDIQLQDGTSQGRRMRIARMNVKVYQSLAGEYSTDGVNWNPLIARKLTDPMDSSPPVLSGYERAYVSSNWADGVDIWIRQTLPVPLTIAALVPSIETSEMAQS